LIDGNKKDAKIGRAAISDTGLTNKKYQSV